MGPRHGIGSTTLTGIIIFHGFIKPYYFWQWEGEIGKFSMLILEMEGRGVFFIPSPPFLDE